MATCPECEYDEIDTADQEEGDAVSCPECGKNLVVVGSDELDFADDDEDDLDDDEDDEDEDEDEEDEADELDDEDELEEEEQE